MEARMTDQEEEEVTAKLVAQSTDIHGEENFLQGGCSFSPDGLCVLTSTAADSKLRLYNTPPPCDEQEEKDDKSQQESSTHTKIHPWKTILSANAGDSVRSHDWYPTMKSTDPASCCFLATARDQPVHLYDAYSGAVRATYRPFNALDELESPTVATFSPDGQKIYTAGFRTDRTIHIFDAAIPGRDSTILHLGKTKRSSDGQKGLVSALSFGGAVNNNHIFAVGTYAPGSIYIYDSRTEHQQASGTVLNGLCVVGHGKGHGRKKRRFAYSKIEKTDGADNNDHDDDDNNDRQENWLSSAKVKWCQSRVRGGVTQVTFASGAGEYILYSASRRSNAILSWDLRMLSGNPEYQSNPVCCLASFETRNDTNQRLEFDIDAASDTLYVGGQDNCVRIYRISSGKLIGRIDNLDDAVNGVSFAHNKTTGQSFLVAATGSRRFSTATPASESDDDEDDEEERILVDNQDRPPGTLYMFSLSTR